MSVARLTARKMRVTSLKYLIKALDSYEKLIMSLKAVYALVACVYFCISICNFFLLRLMSRYVCHILLHFCHWAWARPYPAQNLPYEFYIKEHSKPLFNKMMILNLKNLYFYHCAKEAFEMLKFRSPIAVHNLYKSSMHSQNNLFIITATSVSILKLKL